jgi:hypothetical protein
MSPDAYPDLIMMSGRRLFPRSPVLDFGSDKHHSSRKARNDVRFPCSALPNDRMPLASLRARRSSSYRRSLDLSRPSCSSSSTEPPGKRSAAIRAPHGTDGSVHIACRDAGGSVTRDAPRYCDTHAARRQCRTQARRAAHARSPDLRARGTQARPHDDPRPRSQSRRRPSSNATSVRTSPTCCGSPT